MYAVDLVIFLTVCIPRLSELFLYLFYVEIGRFGNSIFFKISSSVTAILRAFHLLLLKALVFLILRIGSKHCGGCGDQAASSDSRVRSV